MPASSTQALVGMGSNLGDRLAALIFAVEQFDMDPQVAVRKVSPIYETEAHTRPEQEAQPDHLNAVIWLDSLVPPEVLMQRLIAIEDAFGRKRGEEEWGPRTLDLDLLLFGEHVAASKSLTIPHPRLRERRFVLQPMADLVHNLPVPGADGASVADLLARCPDVKRVRRTSLQIHTDRPPHE